MKIQFRIFILAILIWQINSVAQTTGKEILLKNYRPKSIYNIPISK